MKISVFSFLAAALCAVASAQFPRREATCPQLVACLSEFDRQIQQCESNAANNPRANRFQQLVQEQCGVDTRQLRTEKRGLQNQRKRFMDTCVAQNVVASNQAFCASTQSSTSNNPRQCFRQANRCRQECMEFKRGCIKAGICHEQYETGLHDGLHDQIHRINLQLLEAQECIQRLAASGQLTPNNNRQNRFYNVPNYHTSGQSVNRDLPGFEELFED